MVVCNPFYFQVKAYMKCMLEHQDLKIFCQLQVAENVNDLI